MRKPRDTKDLERSSLKESGVVPYNQLRNGTNSQAKEVVSESKKQSSFVFKDGKLERKFRIKK